MQGLDPFQGGIASMGLGPGLLLTGFEDPGDKITVHSVWTEVEVGMEEQRSCTRVGSSARGRPRGKQCVQQCAVFESSLEHLGENVHEVVSNLGLHMPTLLEYGYASYTCPFLLLSPYAIWHQTPNTCHFPQSCSDNLMSHFTPLIF